MFSDIIEDMSHKIAVITVVYQNYEILKDFLSSFEKQKNKNFHIFISDLSDEKSHFVPLSGTSEGKQLTIIPSINRGYAYGINLGLKKAINQGYDKFCIINSDTYVDKNFVNSVLVSISHNPSSLIGGKIYYAPGYEYHKNKYSADELGKVIWYAGGEIDWKNVFIKHKGVDEIDKNQFDKLEETDFVTGCLMAFDKTVIDKVGFWDEKYFLYFEDADYCIRAKKNGIKLYYDPLIVIWHKNAQSTQGSGSKLHLKYQEKNRLRFSLKYAPLKIKLHVLKNYVFKKLMK